MDRRAAGALLALAACIACSAAAPTVSDHTALDLYDGTSEGCYYNFQHYGEGDRIMTNEPCLNCTCHNKMLMCYLRVCPFTKPIGQDCTVEKRADQCCPIVTCPDVPVDLLTSTSTTSPAEYGATGIGKLDKYGCTINEKYFPEGSKVPPTPNKPCEHCYCIRNMTTCVMQECTLHVDGCTPIYHKDVCCPVRYSCDHPEDEILLLDDMTTTVRPTPGFLLTTTTISPVTQMTQDCIHDDQVFADGALIKTEKACEHCYCMKGDIVCVVQECGTPMENEGKNCSSLPPREGQCCPDTYICEGDEQSTELPSDVMIQEEMTTLSPPRRVGVEGSGYRNEPDEAPQTESSATEVEMEGSGEEQPNTLPEVDTSDLITPETATPAIIDEYLATTEKGQHVPITTSPPKSDEIGVSTQYPEPSHGINIPGEVPEDVNTIPDHFISSTTVVPAKEEQHIPSTTTSLVQDVEISTAKPIDGQDLLPGTISEKESSELDQFIPISTSAPLADLGEKDTTEQTETEDIIPSITPISSEQEQIIPVTTSAPSIEESKEPSTEPDQEQDVKPGNAVEVETEEPEEYISITTHKPRFEETDTSSVVLDVSQSDAVTEKKYSEIDQHISSTNLPEIDEGDMYTTETIDGHEEASGTITTKGSEPELIPVTTTIPILHETVEESTRPSITSEAITEKEGSNLDQFNQITTSLPTVDDYDHLTTKLSGEKDISPGLVETTDRLVPEKYIPKTTSSLIVDKEEKMTTAIPHEESLVTEHFISRTTVTSSLELGELTTVTPNQEQFETDGITKKDMSKPQPTGAPAYEENEKTTIGIDKEQDSIASITSKEQTLQSEVPKSTEPTTSIKDTAGGETTSIAFDSSSTSPEESYTITTEATLRKEDNIVSIDTKKPVESTTVKTESITESVDIETKPTILSSVEDQKTTKEDEIKEPIESSTTTIVKEDEKEPSFETEEKLVPITPAADKLNPPETTTINIGDNEIDEDSIITSGRIPGEGDCLLNGITYRNETIVPSTNNCHIGCRCISSIIKCEPIICSPPPEYMNNCQPTYDSSDSCCPTYVCDHSKETIPPESQSQMSGTESPVSSPAIECRGDQCEISEEKVQICTSDDCLKEPSAKPESVDCGLEDCSHIQTPTHPQPVEHPEECEAGKCEPSKESCANGKCQLPPIVEQALPVKPCEGDHCEEKLDESIIPQIPIVSCDGESGSGDCSSTVVSLPQDAKKDVTCTEENGCQKPQDETKLECVGESCRRKGSSNINTELPPPCADSECAQQIPTQHSLDTDISITKLPEEEKGTLDTSQDSLVTKDQEVHTDLPTSHTVETETTTSKISEKITTETYVSPDHASSDMDGLITKTTTASSLVDLTTILPDTISDSIDDGSPDDKLQKKVTTELPQTEDIHLETTGTAALQDTTKQYVPIISDLETELTTKSLITENQEIPLSPTENPKDAKTETTLSPAEEPYDVETEKPLAPTEEPHGGETESPLSPAEEPHSGEAESPLSPTEEPHDAETETPLSPAEEPHVEETESPVSPAVETHDIEAESPLSAAEEPHDIETVSPLSPAEKPHDVETESPLSPVEETHEIETETTVSPTVEIEKPLSPAEKPYVEKETPLPPAEEPHVVKTESPMSPTEKTHDEGTESPLSSAEEPHTAETESPLSPAEKPHDVETESPLSSAEEPHIAETESSLSPAEKTHDVETESPLPPAEEPHDVETESPLSPAEESHTVETESPLSPAEKPHDVETESPLSPAEEPHDVETESPLPHAEEPHDVETESPLSPAEESHTVETESPLSPAEKPHDVDTESPLSPAEEPHDVETESPLSPAEEPHDVKTESPLSPAEEPHGEETESPLSPAEKTHDVETESPLSPAEEPHDVETESPLTPAEKPHDVVTDLSHTEEPHDVETESPSSHAEEPHDIETEIPLSSTEKQHDFDKLPGTDQAFGYTEKPGAGPETSDCGSEYCSHEETLTHPQLDDQTQKCKHGKCEPHKESCATGNCHGPSIESLNLTESPITQQPLETTEEHSEKDITPHSSTVSGMMESDTDSIKLTESSVTPKITEFTEKVHETPETQTTQLVDTAELQERVTKKPEQEISHTESYGTETKLPDFNEVVQPSNEITKSPETSVTESVKETKLPISELDEVSTKLVDSDAFKESTTDQYDQTQEGLTTLSQEVANVPIKTSTQILPTLSNEVVTEISDILYTPEVETDTDSIIELELTTKASLLTVTTSENQDKPTQVILEEQKTELPSLYVTEGHESITNENAQPVTEHISHTTLHVTGTPFAATAGFEQQEIITEKIETSTEQEIISIADEKQTYPDSHDTEPQKISPPIVTPYEEIISHETLIPSITEQMITTESIIPISDEEKIKTEPPKLEEMDISTDQTGLQHGYGLISESPEAMVTEEPDQTIDKSKSEISDDGKIKTESPEQHDDHEKTSPERPIDKEVIPQYPGQPNIVEKEEHSTEIPVHSITEQQISHTESMPIVTEKENEELDIVTSKPLILDEISKTGQHESNPEKFPPSTNEIQDESTEVPAMTSEQQMPTKSTEISSSAPQEESTDEERVTTPKESVTIKYQEDEITDKTPQTEIESSEPYIPVHKEEPSTVTPIVQETDGSHKVSKPYEESATEQYDISTKQPEFVEESYTEISKNDLTKPQELVTKAPEIAITEEAITKLSDVVTETPDAIDDSKSPITEIQNTFTESPNIAEDTHTETPLSLVTEPHEIKKPEDASDHKTTESVVTNLPGISDIEENEIHTEITSLIPEKTESSTKSVELPFSETFTTESLVHEVQTNVPEMMLTESQILGSTEKPKESTTLSEEIYTEKPSKHHVTVSEQTETETSPIITEDESIMITTDSSVPLVTEAQQITTKHSQEISTELQNTSTDIPKKSKPDEQEQYSETYIPVTTESQVSITKISEIVTEQEKVTMIPDQLATEKTDTMIHPELHETKEPVETGSKLPEENIITTSDVAQVIYDTPESTPYLIELEEHTHKREEELSTTIIPELTTRNIDTQQEQKVSEITTEKPTVEENPTSAADIIPVKEDVTISSVDSSHPSDEVYEKTTQSSVLLEETPSPTTSELPASHDLDDKNITETEITEPSTSSPLIIEKEHTTLRVPADTGSSIQDLIPTEKTDDEKETSSEKPLESDVPFVPTSSEEALITTPKTTTPKFENAASQTPAPIDKYTKTEEKPSEMMPSTTAPESSKPGSNEIQPADEVPTPEDGGHSAPSGTSGYGPDPDYFEEDQTFGPGTCRYGGKVYVSAQQIPRDDPCDFCFCFRSDIICLQQSCPPPIHGCHEEPIQGFCCPRYECPVSMATTLNVTTTTTTTTTTLPPHFPTHSYKGAAQRRGCQIKGHTYKVGEVVRASSGPCLHCTCGGDGQMKCDPKACTPEPMLRQMIAAAVSAKRRR